MSANIDKWHLGKEQKINVGMRELNFNKDKKKKKTKNNGKINSNSRHKVRK